MDSVLTIRAAQNPGYYERREFARDEYYSERGSTPGQWIGRGAQTLDLTGAPELGDLGQLLTGEHPDAGERLEGLRRGRRNAGFDLTWTAPKSVSVLLAVGDDHIREAVLAAQEAGVRAGLDYLERYECQARRGAGGHEIVEAGGFAGAIYAHEISRTGDPHLHTHLVIANAVQGPDGRWTAQDMRPVFAAAKTAGTVAEAVMRTELTRRIGVAWGPVRNGTAEIAGMPLEVTREFSRRRTEIVELALARGASSIQAVGSVQRETRDRKPHLDRDEAVGQWRARAAEHGLGRYEIPQLLYRAHLVELSLIGEAQLSSRLSGPTGLTHRTSTFRRRDVIRAIAENYPGGARLARIEQLADQWIRHRAILVEPPELSRTNRTAWTTPEMLDIEHRLVAGAQRRGRLWVDPGTVEAVLAGHPEVGNDQAAAVRHLTANRDAVRLMIAPAGTGKTYTLGLVREALERDGIEVVGCSWQGEAAQVLERDAGIRSRTIAGLLADLERDPPHALAPRSVLVIDEAGTVPTRALEQLVSHASDVSATVLMIGDPRQLPSIDAGGALASLAERIGAVELSENRRQVGPLQQEIARSLSQGRPERALELLTDHGHLKAFETRDTAMIELVSDWAKTSAADPSRALILAHDRADVLDLNQLAREHMDTAGLLGSERLNVAGREWAVGDRIVCRRNDYRPEIDVRNGTRGTVIAIDPAARSLELRTDDGRQVQLPTDYLEHAHHGYAITGHISQGATTDRTYLFAAPERGSREWGYAAGSRHRHDLHVYVVGLDQDQAVHELARGWERTQAKHLAIDRMPEVPMPEFRIGRPNDLAVETPDVNPGPARPDVEFRIGGPLTRSPKVPDLEPEVDATKEPSIEPPDTDNPRRRLPTIEPPEPRIEPPGIDLDFF